MPGKPNAGENDDQVDAKEDELLSDLSDVTARL